MLSLEQYESDLPFLLGSNKKGWVRVCQILDMLLPFCNGGYNVHRLFSLGAMLV